MSSASKPGLVYVMFSRVCSLEQLHIVDKFDPDKITVDENVKIEVARMNKVSVNNNPCNWMNPKAAGLKVCSLNVRSLRRHIEDVKSDPVLVQSDILCLQEIWLNPGEEEDSRYQLEGFKGHFTCVGSGKGVAVYVRLKLYQKAAYSFHSLSEPFLQFGKVSLENLDVITIYRSQEERFLRAAHFLKDFIDLEKTTLLVGDLNYCSVKDYNDLSKYLTKEKFNQLVTLPTHIDGGLLDHAHLRQSQGRKRNTEVKTYTHYYSDHDSVTVILR